jgi:hypothetical protein
VLDVAFPAFPAFAREHGSAAAAGVLLAALAAGIGLGVAGGGGAGGDAQRAARPALRRSIGSMPIGSAPRSTAT